VTTLFQKGRIHVARLTALGWPILSSAVAALLAIVGLVQPTWSYEVNAGGGSLSRRTYLWTWLIQENYEQGVWDGTLITPYAGPSFGEFRMRETVGAVYLVALLLAIALLVLVAMQYAARSRKLPVKALTVVQVFAIGLGFAVISLALLTIPPAATTDVAPFVSGFFGATTVGGIAVTWGPGLSWWLWLVSTILALVVFVVPFAQGGMGRRVSTPG